VFGATAGATLENLGVINFNYVTRDRCGGLAGQLENSSIVNNCYSSGTLYASSRSGGLVGVIAFGSTMSNCYSSATVNGTSTRMGGLAGQIYECGVINNCHATGDVTGTDQVGGFVGFSYISPITNCYAHGKAIGNNYVGGFTGHNQGMSGTIQSCYATGYVSGNNYVGGFVGENFHGTIIDKSFSLGDVHGNNSVGGFAGRQNNNPGGAWYPWTELKNCFSRGNVFGNDYVGGFIGNSQVLETYLTHCLATGYVQGVSQNTGGFASSIATGATTVASCYWNTETSNQASSAAGFGRTTEQLTYPYSNAYVGWNFASIWKHDVSYQYNGGYPYLIYQENIVSSPFVITSMVQANTATNSIGGGYVLSENGQNLTERGLLVSLEQHPTLENYNQKIIDAGTAVGSFASSIDGLQLNAIYYARAYSINSNGVSYGSPIEFTSLGKAIIDNQTTTNITINSAQVNGMVHFIGYLPASEHGVCWNTTGNPTTDDDKTELGPILQKGLFSSVLEDLEPNTTYYARIYHIVETGTFYNDEISFITHTPVEQPEGEGTESNPYLIANMGNLRWIADNNGHWNKHYLQTANIDAAETVTYSNNTGWVPIGNSTIKFTGTYNGGGHNIFNLYINRPSGNYQGLFGYTQNAVIRNLNLANSYIKGNSSVGGLIGSASETAVMFCSSVADIIGTSSLGGITGALLSSISTIYYSYSEGTITGNSHLGGISGSQAYYSVIADCYSHAQISGVTYVGGLVGEASYVGRSYSTGLVTGGGSYVGGFIGRGGWPTYCYWDTETSGQAASAGGAGVVGKTTAQMQSASTWKLFNFAQVWEMGTKQGYPVFKDLTIYDLPVPVALSDLAGSGTAEYPYIITTASELNAMQLNRNAHYKLANDIDLVSSVIWNNGRGFTPVGTQTAGQRFTGSLDGNNHTISNLIINRTDLDYLGLFGYTDGANIRNLHLEGFNVYGRNYIGGLIGISNVSTLTNAHINGEVLGGSYLGGISGQLLTSAVLYSSSNIDILGTTYLGGIIGHSSASTIYYSFSVGNITGQDYLGGITGKQHNNLSVIADCYSHAKITGTSHLGGLVGQVEGGSVGRCFSTGLVTGGSSYVGGFIGRGGWPTYCYWDTETSGQAASAGGAGVVGKTTAQMQSASTWKLFNFAQVWEMGTKQGYPVFKDLTIYDLPQPVTLGDLEGSGTAEDPYIITTASELNAMQLNRNAHYKLANDIDLVSSVIWNNGRGFTSVGTQTAGQRFTGSFDGNNHTISNLIINRPDVDYLGLFGYTDGANIRNLHLEGFNFYGRNSIGGLCGISNISALTNVHINGEVLGGSYLGGISGQLLTSAVLYSSSGSDILGTHRLGGIAGYSSASTIYYSFSDGNITGYDYLGGITGFQHNNLSVIADSYSHAKITGSSHLGGLVGQVDGGSIGRCFSAGLISGGTSYVGGFIGRGGWPTYCYWDKETSGQSTSAGGAGVVGKTTAQMKQQATFPQFNFATLWQIEEEVSYPEFQDLTMYDFTPPQLVDLSTLSGSGTADNPYIITNTDELNSMRQNLAAHYKLGNNIDLSNSLVWDNGRGWNTIGANSSASFTGSFDGNGYTITGLNINKPNIDNQGLFGYINNATIKNVNLPDAKVCGNQYCGLLVGYSNNSNHDGSVVEGLVVSASSNIGGMIGYATGSQFHYLSSNVNVSGNSNTGGLIGYNYIGNGIRHCWSAGSVNGGASVGGLVGNSSNSNISDCYSLASVKGTSNVGGFAGYLSANNVYRSYSVGFVSGTGSGFGGFIGNGGTASYCYWDTETSGRTASAGGTGVIGKTTAQMKQQATYPQFNFQTLWEINEGNSYPVFQNLRSYDFTYPAVVDLTTLSGSGTAGDPYILTNASELYSIRQNLAAHYKLANDIDLSNSIVWFYGRGWWRIGTDVANERFTGSLNGNGHSIIGMHINRPNHGYHGLFAYLSNASVYDLNFENAIIHGGQYTGALSGYSSTSSIENTHVNGWVISSNDQTGGIIGDVSGGMLSNLSADVFVIGGAPYNTGGVCGAMRNGAQLLYAFSIGEVRGIASVGGLVGAIHVATDLIKDSYSRANVYATTTGASVGGLLGTRNGGNIENSFSTGLVDGPGPYGGLVGFGNGTYVTNSYWNLETSGRATSAGGAGAMGRTTEQMTHPYAANTYQTWDFANTWIADEYYFTNNGYPYLSWQKPKQAITLPSGWSGLSSYLIPAQPAMEDAFAPIADQLIIAQTMSGVYFPGQNLNTIGNWESHSAYKIKVTEACDLLLSGTHETDMTIALDAGWSLLPVVTSENANADDLFTPVSGFEMAKDVAGTGVYWPQYGINNMGIIMPGKAYYVLMSEAGVVDFTGLKNSNNPTGINLTGLQDLTRPDFCLQIFVKNLFCLL
jgi:hypothetical protein